MCHDTAVCEFERFERFGRFLARSFQGLSDLFGGNGNSHLAKIDTVKLARQLDQRFVAAAADVFENA